MKRIVKQAAGIDVAQKELVVCLGCIDDDLGNRTVCAPKVCQYTKRIYSLTWLGTQAYFTRHPFTLYHGSHRCIPGKGWLII